jgi:nuclear pore complex protein Nup188
VLTLKPTPNLSSIGTSLRTAAQLATVALLRFQTVLSTLEQLTNPGEGIEPPTPDAGYLWNPDGIKDINTLFMDMADRDIELSASAMFAWTLIADSIAAYVPSSRRGSEDSSGGIRYPSLPRATGANPCEDLLAQAFSKIKSNLPVEASDFIPRLAHSAIDRFSLFEQVANMTICLNATYGDAGSETYKTQARRLLLELIETVVPHKVKYSEDTLRAVLVLLGAELSYWDFVDQSFSGHDVVKDYFVDDERRMIASLFGEALSRYPAESVPFHQLARAMVLNGSLNNESILGILSQIESSDRFTKKFPPNFQGYREVVDDDMDDYSDDDGVLPIPYRLSQDLPYFVSSRQGQLMLPSTRSADNRELALVDDLPPGMGCVPAGATGVVADEVRPITINWNHQYSPLRYMVCSLYTSLAGNDWKDVSTGAKFPLDEVCDVLRFLTTLILAIQRSQSNGSESEAQDAVRTIVETSWVEADLKKDLLNIVAELFEDQLQLQQDQPGQEDSMAVLVCCVEFFHAVTASVPGRIWPVLARSRLLDLDGNGGGLVAVVTAVEMITGSYDFLISCIRLFEILVDASLKPGSETPSQTSRALTRFNSQATRQPGGEVLPQRVASAVVASYTRILISVFGNSRSWRYSSSQDQAEISARLSMIFDRVLHYAYGFDDNSNLSSKVVTSILADSASHLADVLLSDSPTHQLSDSLLDMLRSGLATLVAERSSTVQPWQISQITSALNLYETALRVGIFADRPTSFLEKQLFTAAPVLARLFAAQGAFKAPVSAVLEALVTSAARNQTEPPSLLGHMGSGPARDFLSVLGHLGRPLNDLDVELGIWKMLSAVVRSRQQWFAISLLTGNAPRDRRKQRKDTVQAKVHGKAMLAYALDFLANISNLDPKHALVVSKFVSLCQNHWSWAVGSLRTHPTFIDGLTGYVRSLKREDSDSPLHICNEAALAASIAEILAMHLHSAFQVGDPSASKSIVPHLQYFRKYGVAAPYYNSSLHANLKSYMVKDYGGLQPANFKHTLAFPTSYGTNYFYDLPFASKVLNLRRSRKGIALQGIEKDLEHANSSLSLVEAQINLMDHWKLLLLELSKSLKQNGSVVALLIEVVQRCLKENASSSVPQAIFDRLRYKRLDLALVLLQRLVALDMKDTEQEENLRNLFALAWDTIVKADQDFDNAFQNADVHYYRTQLQILFLCLKPLVKARPQDTNHKQSINGQRKDWSQPPKDSRHILEVLLHVVAKGFRSLAGILHEDPSGCEPNDFVLLTAILQIILRIPGIELLHSQIALQFASSNLTGYATSLFSWADRLIVDGDPIFGEYAILFLLEMSSVPLIAENMAVDGVLSQITSADIMQLYARPKGMGPFDAPIRLHSIWTRGLLPLCLNLLDAVGAPIAAEIVSFLNHFPNQLKRVSTELGNRNSPIGPRPNESHITLGMASEVHSLSLIWLILERYRDAGAGTGTLMQDIPQLNWDKASVKEDVDDWVQERMPLGPMVLPANEREAEFARAKALKKGASRLEEKIILELIGAGECLKGD